MTDFDLPRLLALLALGVVYFFVGVFRSAYAELNPVTSSRILASRGFRPREGESPGDVLPVMRVTFDLMHHLVLLAATSICIITLRGADGAGSFVPGVAALVVVVVVLQVGARMLALIDPEKAFSASLVVILSFYRLFSPVLVPVGWIFGRIRRSGRRRRQANPDEEAAEEEIEAFIDAGQKEGLLEAEEGNLIRQVVEFHDKVVKEVMTPRTKVVALPITATVAEARALIAKKRRSRLPVYRDQIDNVEGVITLKDLVANWEKMPEDTPVSKLMRPPFFVPETKHVSGLLKEMQARRFHLAIVVDEYGGAAGVVTIEDLLEELVGEIQEEHEREHDPVVKEPDGSYTVLGTTNLDDLSAALGVDLQAEGFETASGFIHSILGRIPASGEVIEHDGLKIEILKVDSRRIDRIRITVPESSRTE